MQWVPPILSRGPQSPTDTPIPNWKRLGRTYGVWETQAAHIQQAACPQLQLQPGESKREILVPKTLRGTGRLSDLTEKDVLPFWRSGVHREPGSSSEVHCGCHRVLFEEGSRGVAEQETNEYTAALTAKRPDSKRSSCLLNPAGQEEWRAGGEGTVGPHSVWLACRELHTEWRV